MLRRTAPALLALALLTACGGEDSATDRDAAAPSPTASPTPTGPPALAKAEFLAQAEAVCKDALATLEGAPEPQSPEQVGPFFEAQLATAKTATTELEALAAPQPDRAELDRIFLTALRAQVTELEAFLPALKAAVGGGAEALAALPEPELQEPDFAAMRAYGFSSCIEVGETE